MQRRGILAQFFVANETAALQRLASADVLVITGGSEFGVLAALLARDSTIVTFASCDKQKSFTHDLGLRYKGSFGPAGRPITLADRLQAQFKLQNMTSCQHNGSGLDP